MGTKQSRHEPMCDQAVIDMLIFVFWGTVHPIKWYISLDRVKSDQTRTEESKVESEGDRHRQSQDGDRESVVTALALDHRIFNVFRVGCLSSTRVIYEIYLPIPPTLHESIPVPINQHMALNFRLMCPEKRKLKCKEKQTNKPVLLL